MQYSSRLFVLSVFIFIFITNIAYCGTCWNGGFSGSAPWQVKDGDEGADSVERVDVEYCVNTVAAANDTVNVPAGTATWATGITLSKHVHLVGAAGVYDNSPSRGCGTQNTVITMTAAISGTLINIGSTASQVSGFHFIIESGAGTYQRFILAKGSGAQVDNNKFENQALPYRDEAIKFIGDEANPTPSATFFHNTLIGACRILVEGYDVYAQASWYTDYLVGDDAGTPRVVIEDNITTSDTAVYENAIDHNYGTVILARNNYIQNMWVEIHGVINQTGYRGARLSEFYWNDIVYTENPSFAAVAFKWRTGSGIIWGNSAFGNFAAFGRYISFSNARYDSGLCNGTHGLDENADATGYKCRDQVGSGKDESLFDTACIVADTCPHQDAVPVYEWQNSAITTRSLSSSVIAENRDYYTYGGVAQTNKGVPFDGTIGTGTGVGVGILGNRPDTCSTGVAYWATDQGDWNQITAGTQGVLYKCTATDTWSVFYTPLEYPHPAQVYTPPIPPPTSYTITIDSADNDFTSTPTCVSPCSIASGTVLTLLLKNISGFNCQGWKVGEVFVTSNNEYSWIVQENTAVTGNCWKAYGSPAGF